VEGCGCCNKYEGERQFVLFKMPARTLKDPGIPGFALSSPILPPFLKFVSD
jgi:hypothetical protein